VNYQIITNKEDFQHNIISNQDSFVSVQTFCNPYPWISANNPKCSCSDPNWRSNSQNTLRDCSRVIETLKLKWRRCLYHLNSYLTNRQHENDPSLRMFDWFLRSQSHFKLFFPFVIILSVITCGFELERPIHRRPGSLIIMDLKVNCLLALRLFTF
jgi:hypothetical protein